MKTKKRSGRRTQMVAGSKLYKKTLKSMYGMVSWREHFDAKALRARKN